MTVPVPPWLLRRLLLAPLMPVLAAIALALFPVVVVLQGLGAGRTYVAGLVRPRRQHRPIRWRLPRVWAFAIIYLTVETCCLLSCLALWLASGCGWRLQSPRQQAWHLALLRRVLATLVAAAGFVFRFRLTVEEPETAAGPDRMAAPKPILVLARHAGPGASFVLVHLLLSRYGRRVRVVMKEQLRLDPSFDVLLTRLGCSFIATGRRRHEDPVEVIARAAGALTEGDALLLYPEGGDWTPTRQLLAVRRLRRRGLLQQARQAEGMPHVLPPRPAGTLAALRAAPYADVVVFNHTGQDQLIDALSIWHALPLRRSLDLIWWREPVEGIPQSDEDRISWLLTLWQRIDAWIAEQHRIVPVHGERPAGHLARPALYEGRVE